MLVYANYLSFQGVGAEEAILKGIGAWLKEQLGHGLHPAQLKQGGHHDGTRGDSRSWLQNYIANLGEPKLYAWVLKNSDAGVRGRQWITELGLKEHQGSLEFSCVLKTDERSTLVSDPVSASRPRVIQYIATNIREADNADFATGVVGIALKSVGRDVDSYRALLAEIERRDRDSPIVLVSPARDGQYLVDAADLQRQLIGLAQVVQVLPDFNSYDMANILGQPWSAWGGAVNILHIPTPTGSVRGRFFLSDEIEGWGNTPRDRVSELLSWVTNNTNIPRLRNRIRPEGVTQLALRRRLQLTLDKSGQMNADQLRQKLRETSEQIADQAKFFTEITDQNASLESDVVELVSNLRDETDELAKKKFELQSLKDQLANTGSGRASEIDVEFLVGIASRKEPPSSSDCVKVIENIYGNECVVLDTARKSARDMNRFTEGRKLLDMLKRLVTVYRDAMIVGGDNEARKVFGKREYAANESETVTKNKAMRRARTFEYRGKEREMFRHLKIGIDDDISKTIRVHFDWDAEQQKIVIGYCGKHLQIASR